MDELLAAITPATRAVLIANPNNPTGTAIDLAGIKKLIEAAPNAAVLIDEAYFEFSEITALPWIRRISEFICQPDVLEGVWHGGYALRMLVFRGSPTSDG